MSVSMMRAINAYNNVAKNKGAAQDSQKDGAAADFGDMVKQAARDAIDVNRKAEDLSLAAVAGKADLNEVITAVADAEVTVQAVVALRDKVIDAYNQIMRMPM